MSKQTAPPLWVDVNEAAALAGKSISTIRRLLPEIEEKTPGAIRREPIEGKGGEKVLLSRAYLVERFKLKEPEPQGDEESAPQEERRAGKNVVQMLERQLEAKDRQIDAISRQLEQEQQTLGDIAESLRQAVAVNTVLNNKLLALTEKAGEGRGPGVDEAAKGRAEPAGGFLNSPFYFVVLAVCLSLVIGLLVWLFIGWAGES